MVELGDRASDHCPTSARSAPDSGPDWPTRLRRTAVTSWRWRAELLIAIPLLPIVSFRLRRDGYGPTRAWLDRRLERGRLRRARPHRAVDSVADGAGSVSRELAFVVRLASRPTPDATCLRQALVLRHLLARRSIPSVIKVGASQDPPGSGGARFHAWVEVEGEVVSEPAHEVAGHRVLFTERPPQLSPSRSGRAADGAGAEVSRRPASDDRASDA